MLHVYTCITEQHDGRLVALALVVAALGCHATFSLLRQSEAARGVAQLGWLLAAAVTAGSATWATHFIAVLAFAPGVPTGYAPGLTALSFAIGIGAMVLAFAIGMKLSRAWGGVIAGLGVGAMHYTGMAAFRVSGILVWDRPMVAASLLIGAGLGMAAFLVGIGGAGRLRRAAAAGLLALAIGGLHFTGMAASSIIPDGTRPVPPASLPPMELAISVALGCLLVLGLGALALFLEERHARRSAIELGRMHDLADATVEGLLVCDGELVVTANRSFAALIGWPPEALSGMHAADLVRQTATGTEEAAAPAPGDLAEGSVMSPSGDPIPVEMVIRTVNYGGRPHRVIACRDLRARRVAEARARFLARHDALTGLPNRAKFMEHLARAQAGPDGRRLAVLVLDIDRFKAVNDALGHAQGDTLLREVAQRLRDLAAKGDLIAGFGGDEFAILCGAATDPAEAARLAQRIAAGLALPFSIAGEPVSLTVSIGIAVTESGTEEAEALLQHADLALQRAKRDGGHMHCFYEPAMDLSVQQARALELDLRAAVGRDEMEVWFQPQLTLLGDTLAGFEALLRWRHPQRGLISPGAFIPLAEESGLITPIGAAVLRTAMATAQSWPAQLSVAINLSPVQLRSPDLFGTITAALEETGLDPRRLELEVTETVLLDGDPAIVRVMHRLRTLGIRMALDDFGTGFSSLSYLRSFPFDKLKIDRSFVGEVTTIHECRAIVRAIIGLGRDLNITTTAEGVETEAQLEFLRQEGCDEVQGYLLGRPMPAEAARDMIRVMSGVHA